MVKRTFTLVGTEQLIFTVCRDGMWVVKRSCSVVLCSGAGSCVLKGLGKNYFGISKIRYPRYAKTTDMAHLEMDLSHGNHTPMLWLPIMTRLVGIFMFRLSSVVTCGHWVCKPAVEAPVSFSGLVCVPFLCTSIFYIVCIIRYCLLFIIFIVIRFQCDFANLFYLRGRWRELQMP